MAKTSSTMSPKRLFILLCLAGLLMWFFSNSEVEVSVESDKDLVEEVVSVNEDTDKEIEKEEKKEPKKKKRSRKNSTKKQDNNEDVNSDYLQKRELDYDPNSRNTE